MVNTMQSEGNSECIYISDESPNVPQLSALSKASAFTMPETSSNLSMPLALIDEIEMEDVSDEIIVPDTPSPLLNNKRQQHLTLGRGIKRTCLGKAFSTMSTLSNSNTSGVGVQDDRFQNQEGILTGNNFRIINRKESDVKPFATGFAKSSIPSKEKETLFPHKFITKNGNGVYNSARNGILKSENSLNGVQVFGKSKVFPRKRSTVVINSDSDDSTDNMTENLYRNVLHPVQPNYELQNLKETISEKIFQKNRTMAEHPLANKSSSEKLLENYGLLKTRKFTNNWASTSKAEASNKVKSHTCKESNFKSNGVSHNGITSEPPASRSLKKQFRAHKWNSKATCRDHYHEHEPKKSSTGLYNSKSSYSTNSSQSYTDKNSDEASDQRHSHASCVQENAIAGASFRIASGKVRRKHSHRGQIARFPVDDSDSDVEFYDAKSDLSDLGDSKRPNKACRKKRPQRRQKQIMDCLSSDSSSDISVVSEMPGSSFSNATSVQPTRNTESPDPVEQVRQMEEDERLAHMLQAQFDAELEDNDSNEEMCSDLNSSILSNLSVDSASSSSESSSSSFPATGAMFPFLVSSRLSPRILRDINGLRIEQTRRSSRIQQRQQSIIGWMPESVRTVLTAWMPNFADDNTYESLLELSEQIGEESRGLKKQQINSLPTRKFSTINMMDCSPSGSGTQQCQDCTICLCEYQNNDVLRSLPCCHEFHASCIDKWLKSHSTCPICRIEVSLRRSFGRKRKS